MIRDARTPRALELRVARLERALHRTRLFAAGLLALLSLSAMVGWKARDAVRTERLVFTGAGDTAVVVLRAVPGDGYPGLVLETPGGRAVMTLGGNAVRPVR